MSIIVLWRVFSWTKRTSQAITTKQDNQDKRHELQIGEVWIKKAVRSGQRVSDSGVIVMD